MKKNEAAGKLRQLAQEILNMTDQDTARLQSEARNLYEQLTLLHYLCNAEEPVSEAPAVAPAAEEPALFTEQELQHEDDFDLFSTRSQVVNNLFDDSFGFDPERDDLFVPVEKKQPAEEPKHEISEPDIASPVPAGEEPPQTEKTPQTRNEALQSDRKTLNDTFYKEIRISLNDRIVLTKHLFNDEIVEYTHAVIKLNHIETTQEALNYIQTILKPQFGGWSGKEQFEQRFIELVLQKFN